jgi:DHA1 family multidrug resistance protein-like MFS transporter
MESWRKTFHAAWTAQFLAMLGFSFTLPFLPFYITQDLGIPEGPETARWSGILLASVGLPMAVFAPIWGSLSDRYGRKVMVMRSMYGGAVVIALMGLAQNVFHLMALRIAQGVLTGTISASLALVASVTPRERSGYTLGMMQAAVFAGTSIGPFLGGWAAYHFGFRASFICAGLMLLAGAVLVQFRTEERFEPPPPAESHVEDYRTLFAIPGFLAVIFALFILHFASTAPGPVFPLLVKKLSHTDIKEATAITGNIASVVGIVASLLAWYLGRTGDQWGHRRMLLTAALLGGIFSFPVAFARNMTDLYLLRILFGIAAAGMLPSLNCILRDITPPEKIGKAFGITAAVAGLAFFGGALSGGYLSAAAEDYKVPFITSYGAPFILSGILLIVVALIVMLRVPKDRV